MTHSRRATHPDDRPAGRSHAPDPPPKPSHLPPRLCRKLTPEEINALDLVSYDGPIHVVRSSDHMADAAHHLKRERLLGFDTETRPSFRKGVQHAPALLQLAGSDAVYLFQLKRLGLPDALLDLLEDPRIIKAGVANDRDLTELQGLQRFTPRGFVDLGDVAKRVGIQHHGLRGLGAVLLDARISKGAQLSNWELPELPRPAQRYAATDAWIARRIYEAMDEHHCFEKDPPHPRAKATHPLSGVMKRVGAMAANLGGLLGLRRRTPPVHRDSRDKPRRHSDR